MNEYDYFRLKRMKRICSTQGWTLLTYHGIMSAAVMVVMFIITFVYAFNAAAEGGTVDEEMLMDIAVNNGWGYFLAIGVGLLVLLLWKKPNYFVNTVCRVHKPMKFGSFVLLFIIFIGVQGVFQLFAIALEFLLNMSGLSILEGIESAGGSTTDISMFLYVAIGAPVSEEILFRGVVLRSLEPMGKKMAIVTSAMLFGLFHGNIMQIPFAFVVGLLLAYVTFEYNIWWAMLLHMFNNLILSDTLTRFIPGLAGEVTLLVLIYGCLLAGGIILLVKHKAIGQYLKSHKNDPLAYKAFYSNPGMLTLLIYMLVNAVLTLYVLITPLQ